MRLPLLAALAVSAAAASPPGQPLVLKAARLYDGKSGALQSPGVVVIVGGRIAGVGPGAAIPADAVVLELGDATLLPGFIDAHTHLTFEASDWKTDFVNAQLRSVGEQALRTSAHARVTLEAGFTTVRDVGSGELLDVALRNAINAGVVPGPRMVVSVTGIGTTGGHCDQDAIRPGLLLHDQGEGVADGADALRAMVRKNIKYGADVIKVCATGGVLSTTDDVDTPQLTQAELDALVDEAHTQRRKVAAHAHGATGAKRAIRAGVDSIEHGTFLDDEALDLMKARGTVYVPTRLALAKIERRYDTLPPVVVEKARRAVAAGAQALRKAIQKGVIIGFGTDAAVFPHGVNAEEFALLVEAGLKPLDALKAATSTNAALLGLPELGSLEVGKVADVVAVPGDVQKDIRATEHPSLVVKGGVVVARPTR